MDDCRQSSLSWNRNVLYCAILCYTVLCYAVLFRSEKDKERSKDWKALLEGTTTFLSVGRASIPHTNGDHYHTTDLKNLPSHHHPPVGGQGLKSNIGGLGLRCSFLHG